MLFGPAFHSQNQQQRDRRSQCAACRQSRQIQEKAQDYSGFGLESQTPARKSACSGGSLSPFLAARQSPGHAQPSEGVRRTAVLMALPETDPEAKALLSEFTQGLAGLGWADGRNMRMDVRWPASNLDLIREFSKELVDFQPDAILANSTPATAGLQHQTQTIPIVFAIVGDPVGSGFIASLSRPGRNWISPAEAKYRPNL